MLSHRFRRFEIGNVTCGRLSPLTVAAVEGDPGGVGAENRQGMIPPILGFLIRYIIAITESFAHFVEETVEQAEVRDYGANHLMGHGPLVGGEGAVTPALEAGITFSEVKHATRRVVPECLRAGVV